MLKLQNAFTIRFTRNTLAEESIIGRKTFSPARTNMPILKLFISWGIWSFYLKEEVLSQRKTALLILLVPRQAWVNSFFWNASNVPLYMYYLEYILIDYFLTKTLDVGFQLQILIAHFAKKGGKNMLKWWSGKSIFSDSLESRAPYWTDLFGPWNQYSGATLKNRFAIRSCNE